MLYFTQKGEITMKTSKTFRLDDSTISRLMWLAQDLNTTETDIITTAITNLYLSRYYNLDNISIIPPENKNGE